LKNHKRWQNLSHQQREVFRKRYREFHKFSPQEQQRFLEKQKRWRQMPNKEKQNLRRQYKRQGDFHKRQPVKAAPRGKKR